MQSLTKSYEGRYLNSVRTEQCFPKELTFILRLKGTYKLAS